MAPRKPARQRCAQLASSEIASLSGVKSSLSTEPKSDSRRMWWRRQKAAILAVGIAMFPVIGVNAVPGCAARPPGVVCAADRRTRTPPDQEE